MLEEALMERDCQSIWPGRRLLPRLNHIAYLCKGEICCKCISERVIINLMNFDIDILRVRYRFRRVESFDKMVADVVSDFTLICDDLISDLEFFMFNGAWGLLSSFKTTLVVTWQNFSNSVVFLASRTLRET